MHDACCRPRCGRSILCKLLALAVALAFVGLLALTLGIADGHVKTDARLQRQAGWNARQDASLASLGGRLDSTEKHQTDALRYAHQKRAALAGEIRKETAKAVADVRSELDRRALLWGQHIGAERKARRAEVDRLDMSILSAVALTLREQDARRDADTRILHLIAEADRRIIAIEKRLAALEARKPDPPAPPAPAPVVYEWRRIGCALLYGYQDGPVFRFIYSLGR